MGVIVVQVLAFGVYISAPAVWKRKDGVHDGAEVHEARCQGELRAKFPTHPAHCRMRFDENGPPSIDRPVQLIFGGKVHGPRTLNRQADVCIYLYTHICTHTLSQYSIGTHTYILYARIYTYVCIQERLYMYTDIHIYICLYIYIHGHISHMQRRGPLEALSSSRI